jgi:hypothetical protein
MHDDLGERLVRWTVQPQIPPDFQRDVWQKIAARETRKTTAWLSGSWNYWNVSVPGLATCAIVVGVTAGAGLGIVESSQANARNWKTLEVKYVQSVDPYEHLRTY